MNLTRNNDRLMVAVEGCESASVSPTQSNPERQANMTISRTAHFSAQPAAMLAVQKKCTK
jgi:hypothetical protein